MFLNVVVGRNTSASVNGTHLCGKYKSVKVALLLS